MNYLIALSNNTKQILVHPLLLYIGGDIISFKMQKLSIDKEMNVLVKNAVFDSLELERHYWFIEDILKTSRSEYKLDDGFFEKGHKIYKYLYYYDKIRQLLSR